MRSGNALNKYKLVLASRNNTYLQDYIMPKLFDIEFQSGHLKSGGQPIDILLEHAYNLEVIA